jgi:hypothetical protein
MLSFGQGMLGLWSKKRDRELLGLGGKKSGLEKGMRGLGGRIQFDM